MSPLAPVAGLTAPGLNFDSNGGDGQHQGWVDAAGLRRGERRARNADGGAFGQMKAPRDVPRQGCDARAESMAEFLHVGPIVRAGSGCVIMVNSDCNSEVRRHIDTPMSTLSAHAPALRSRRINDRTHCDFPLEAAFVRSRYNAEERCGICL